MVPDPYRALNLPHSATASEIKHSYRELARKLHPDRLMVQHVSSEAERDRATAQFASISSAYAILSDPQRKAQYDHVYKYGGYDVEEGEEQHRKERLPRATSSRSNRQAPNHHHPSSSAASFTFNDNPAASPNTTRKRKSTGIGYACADPFAFLWTNGRVQSQMAVAGIQIPSRLQHPSGVRFAFTSGHLSTSPCGTTKQWQTQTTQFAHGKKYTRLETTTLHADGKKEVVIESTTADGDSNLERRYHVVQPAHQAPPPPQHPQQQQQQQASPDHHHPYEVREQMKTTTTPWYAHAWHGLKDKLMMCYSPCTVTAAQ